MSGCMSSSFSGDIINLCNPLQQLKDEHGPLNEMKKELYDISVIIENNEEANWYEDILNLRNQVERFIAVLDPHSEREEGVLFEMMAKYIGRTSGPIAVMEYEHDQAKSNIARFLKESESLSIDVTKEDAKKLASFVTEAYLILTEHFMKEENVLFPMAEKMLSNEEKLELEEKINQIK
jgi:regulator of cell morphogenesis and NO signaling